MMTENTEATPETGDVSKEQNSQPIRFNIASALKWQFQGLSEAVENNLHRACRAGDCEWIQRIFDGRSKLRSNAPAADTLRPKIETYINERNHLGASPLWLASVSGQEQAVELLIESGANLETEDIKGQTPLYAATKFNHTQCVRILLEAGANPDGSESNISTPIFVTARDNFPRTMTLLIKHGADVNGRRARNKSNEIRSDYPGNLPVYMTLVYRHFECFELLVKGGADLCLPPEVNGISSTASLLQGILRYACDVRYLRLLFFSGGVKELVEVEEIIRVYRNRSDEWTGARKDCMQCLDWIKRNPLSLSHSSRIAIRKNLGQKRLRSIDDLSLPNTLKQYLHLSFLEI